MAVRVPKTTPAKADLREKFIQVQFACMGVGRATMGKKLAMESRIENGRETFFAGSSTGTIGFAQIQPVRKKDAEHARRKDELLEKLEERAVSCPGLYPVRTRAEFLRLAIDHAKGNDEAVCQILEEIWRRPDEALQMNAQSLIRRGMGWGEEKKKKSSKA